MQDPIRDALNEHLKDGKFSQQKRAETLIRAKKSKPKRNWMPFFVSFAAILLAITLVGISTLPNTDQSSATSISSEMNNGQSMEVAVMERYLQAYNLLVDNEQGAIPSTQIDKDARLEYLAESDWLLQRAIESGSSIFYKDAQLTKQERYDLNELLFYLTIWITQLPNENFLPLVSVNSFEQLKEVAPEMNASFMGEFGVRYTTALEEKQKVPKTYFGHMSFENRLGVLVIMVIFAGLFVHNMRRKRNWFFGVIQLGIIGLAAIPMVMPSEYKYTYDETSMLTETLASEELPTDGAKFLYGAEFGEYRYGLLQNASGERLIANFAKSSDIYMFTSVQYFNQDFYATLLSQPNAYIIALFDGHEISRIEARNTAGDVHPLTFEVGKPVIKALYLPGNIGSYSLWFYNENGELIDL